MPCQREESILAMPMSESEVTSCDSTFFPTPRAPCCFGIVANNSPNHRSALTLISAAWFWAITSAWSRIMHNNYELDSTRTSIGIPIDLLAWALSFGYQILSVNKCPKHPFVNR